MISQWYILFQHKHIFLGYFCLAPSIIVLLTSNVLHSSHVKELPIYILLWKITYRRVIYLCQQFMFIKMLMWSCFMNLDISLFFYYHQNLMLWFELNKIKPLDLLLTFIQRFIQWFSLPISCQEKMFTEQVNKKFCHIYPRTYWLSARLVMP